MLNSAGVRDAVAIPEKGVPPMSLLALLFPKLHDGDTCEVESDSVKMTFITPLGEQELAVLRAIEGCERIEC